MSENKHGEWQPMESAPKDGAKVLILVDWGGTRGREVWIAQWNSDCHAKKPRPYWEWVGKSTYIQEMRAHPPLAWMPLPSTELADEVAP
jgi:hypothetical protein